jgi:ribonuclease HI
VLIRDDESEQNSGSETQTTNNRMELQAIISGLLLVQPGSAVQVFTLSDYVYQGVTRWIHGWRQRDWKKRDGRQIANADLWQALDSQSEIYAIQWVNAKGQELDNLETAGILARNACELA